MKRLYISAVLLVLTIFGAIFQLWYVGAKTDRFYQKIEELDALVEAENYETAITFANSAESEWNNTVKAIDTLLIHDYVDSITVSFSKLCAYIESKNKDDYIIESVGIKKGLTSLKESEYPSFTNLM